MPRPTTVLFLCTHNSARSVLSESTLNALGAPRFLASSAGSHPSGRINPLAIELLGRLGHDVSGLRSKSWDEFSGEQAMPLDIVITVCGDAADEVCPVWTGTPVKAHWGIPDPSRVEGGDEAKRAAFAIAQKALAERIERLIGLPVETMAAAELAHHLADIHATCTLPDYARDLAPQP